ASLTLNPASGSESPYLAKAPIGRYVMIGNPSATQSARVTGATVVYTYDPINKYRETTTLQPYQGAWAFSSTGGTITVTPGDASAAAPPSGGPQSSATFPLSPEEAVISLLPYKLAPAEVPAGYVLGDVTVNTSATIAFSAADPKAKLTPLLKAGYVLDLDQTLNPATATSDALTAEFDVVLLADAAATRAWASGQALPPQLDPSDPTLRIEPLALGTTYGDASSAWHVTYTNSGTNAGHYGSYFIRWQRGRLGFEVLSYGASGQEKLDEARALVRTIDALEARRPQPSFGAPTVTPPATEAQ
ncbi:MAG: hypothetical protein ACR2PL_04100, partial [Dehalococcoidia bacterium]